MTYLGFHKGISLVTHLLPCYHGNIQFKPNWDTAPLNFPLFPKHILWNTLSLSSWYHCVVHMRNVCIGHLCAKCIFSMWCNNHPAWRTYKYIFIQFIHVAAIYDILGRTPFVSLVATILCCLGVGLFCGTLNGAIRITVGGIFEGLFLFDVPW